MARTERARVLEKQAQAVAPRRAGHSYGSIANALGYAHRSSAWRATMAALREVVAGNAAEYVGEEVSRLNALQCEIWDRAMSGDLAAANTHRGARYTTDAAMPRPAGAAGGLDAPMPENTGPAPQVPELERQSCSFRSITFHPCTPSCADFLACTT